MKLKLYSILTLSCVSLFSFSQHKTIAGKPMKPIGQVNMAGFGKLSNSLGTASASALSNKNALNPSMLQSNIQLKEVKYSEGSTCPSFIKTKLVKTGTSVETESEARNAALEVLSSYNKLIKVNNPSKEFSLESYEKDAQNITHLKFQQIHNGLPILGKEIMVHFSAHETTINGRYIPTPTLLSTSPKINEANAVNSALDFVKGKTHFGELNAFQKSLLHYTSPQTKLIVYADYNNESKVNLAYHVLVRPNFIERWECIVDASTGTILEGGNTTCTNGLFTSNVTDLKGTTQTLNTYNVGSGYYMIDASRSMFNLAASTLPDNPVGAIWTINAGNSPADNMSLSHVACNDNISWPSAATAASAHSNGAAAYNYYNTTHGRNSIDGQGGTIVSVINVADQNGDPFDNAFWNGELMAYGNGNVAFKPLAKGLDVAGHEMTHGVVQSTAKLVYQGQSGALNESMADVFGTMIDKTNWQIGEDVVNLSYFPSGALRDLSDPHNGTTSGNNGWQPATMSEFVNTSADKGGVHTNSGIPNKAFYIFATAITKQKAEKVYYKALSQYLTSNAQFIDCRRAVVQAATDLYGNGTEVQAAKNAFDQVEIFDGTPTPPPSTVNVSGVDWIMGENTDPADGNSFYVIRPTTAPQASDYHPLNTRHALNNVSIPRRGDVAYFVGKDHNIYTTTTNYGAATEAQLTNTGGWDNVSVSKDGKKLALISQYQDTAIYIYDLVTDNVQKFQLYNPTTAQGVRTNGPLFADAVDWDASGENIMYDCFNSLGNGTSNLVQYWDIGIMNVWNNSTNSFAAGDISKLFSSLPEGLNVADPVYGKKHTDIIAFDVIDQNDGTYSVAGGNLTSGDVGTLIASNNYLATPSFSKEDDRITFTDIQSSDTSLYIKVLDADFINSAASATFLASGAKWSVWYSLDLTAGIETTTDVKAAIYPNPVKDELQITLSGNSENIAVVISDITGRTIQTETLNTEKTTLRTSNWSAGVYFVSFRNSNGKNLTTTKVVKSN